MSQSKVQRVPDTGTSSPALDTDVILAERTRIVFHENMNVVFPAAVSPPLTGHEKALLASPQTLIFLERTGNGPPGPPVSQ